MTLVSKERFLLDNFSLTIDDIELTGFGCAGSCREHTPLRDDEMMTDPSPKDGFEGRQRMAQYWKSKLRIS